MFRGERGMTFRSFLRHYRFTSDRRAANICGRTGENFALVLQIRASILVEKM